MVTGRVITAVAVTDPAVTGCVRSAGGAAAGGKMPENTVVEASLNRRTAERPTDASTAARRICSSVNPDFRQSAICRVDGVYWQRGRTHPVTLPPIRRCLERLSRFRVLPRLGQCRTASAAGTFDQNCGRPDFGACTPRPR